MLLQMAGFHSFVRLSSIPVCLGGCVGVGICTRMHAHSCLEILDGRSCV